MSAAAIAVAESLMPRLTSFEAEFVRTVLEHRGVLARPSLVELTRAFEVLRRYDEQCLANPGRESAYAPDLDADSMAALRAKAYIMFGAIAPSPAQWHKARVALFGPPLCETCG
jgi:hypothetical protein